MDYREIESLIESLSKSNLTYLEIKENDFALKLSKNEPVINNNLDEQVVEKKPYIADLDMEDRITVKEEKVSEHKNEIQEAKVEEQTKEGHKEEAVTLENLESVKSPIVGTFYASSSPEEGPFVNVGSTVKKGETLCIIEAMKLMNEIASPVDGTIVEILCNNEEMVEYNQEIFKIKKQ